MVSKYYKSPEEKLTVGHEDYPQEHQVALVSAPQILMAGSLRELHGRLYGLRQFGFQV